jgi:flagellar biosynthesis protein FlhB
MNERLLFFFQKKRKLWHLNNNKKIPMIFGLVLCQKKILPDLVAFGNIFSVVYMNEGVKWLMLHQAISFVIVWHLWLRRASVFNLFVYWTMVVIMNIRFIYIELMSESFLGWFILKFLDGIHLRKLTEMFTKWFNALKVA